MHPKLGAISLTGSRRRKHPPTPSWQPGIDSTQADRPLGSASNRVGCGLQASITRLSVCLRLLLEHFRDDFGVRAHPVDHAAGRALVDAPLQTSQENTGLQARGPRQAACSRRHSQVRGMSEPTYSSMGASGCSGPCVTTPTMAGVLACRRRTPHARRHERSSVDCEVGVMTIRERLASTRSADLSTHIC